MKKYVVLKLIGLSVLVMITLVVISILEVAVYSYIINPGQEVSVYEVHAESTAPYISGIFGFILFFLVTRHWKKNEYPNVSRLAIFFPLTYLLMDIVIILLAGTVQWESFIVIFVLANAAKFLGSYLGYKLTRSRQVVSA